MNRDRRKKQVGKKSNMLHALNLAWIHGVLILCQSWIMYRLKPLREGLQSDPEHWSVSCAAFLPVASADLGLSISQCLSFPIYTVSSAFCKWPLASRMRGAVCTSQKLWFCWFISSRNTTWEGKGIQTLQSRGETGWGSWASAFHQTVESG